MSQRPMTPPDAKYLGDGVYAWCDGEHNIIATFNGIETGNIIYLNAPTTTALKQFLNGERK